MAKKETSKLAETNYSLRQTRRDWKVMDDLFSGKRKRPPRTWSRTNSVSLPSARWIRAFRRSLKLDFHEFGGLVGMQDADVREWGKGKSHPSVSASRLLGLLALKPHLVKFMRGPWPDNEITKSLKRRRHK